LVTEVGMTFLDGASTRPVSADGDLIALHGANVSTLTLNLDSLTLTTWHGHGYQFKDSQHSYFLADLQWDWHQDSPKTV
jgi:hypothetical protein